MAGKKKVSKKRSASKAVAKKTNQVVVDDKSPKALRACDLEDLIKWRDTARARIKAREEEIKNRLHEVKVLFSRVWKVTQKQKSDEAWCKKLNRAITRKVF